MNRPGVRATGPVSRGKVIEELQRASVFVLASVHDGFGLVLAQAMACGLPVIATEATGIRELITDGVEGIVVSAPPDAWSSPKRWTTCCPTAIGPRPWERPAGAEWSPLVGGIAMADNW